MVGRGDIQETTRLIGKATSVVNMFVINSVVNMFVIKLWMCSLANSDSFH